VPNDLYESAADYEGRLRRLERENTWIKGAVVAIAVLFAINLLVTRPRTFGRLSAQEFDLKDSNGQLRAKLAMLPEGPGLELYAASGEERASLVGAAEDAELNLYLPVTASAASMAGVNLFEGTKPIASLSGGPSSTKLRLDSVEGTVGASLTVGRHLALLGLEGYPDKDTDLGSATTPRAACLKPEAEQKRPPTIGVMMCVDAQGRPTIALDDRDNEMTVLGVAPLADKKPGTLLGSTAASLALLGKDGRVLWSAPR
jgi:hypothetical protein